MMNDYPSAVENWKKYLDPFGRNGREIGKCDNPITTPAGADLPK
jgi:hypothetical protein